MISLLRVSVVCITLLSIGCGPSSTPVEAPETTTIDLIRKDLQPAAETGQLGSEMMSIQGNLDKLADEDPAKAAELREDLEELQGLSGSRAKAKANQMIGKL